MPETKAQIRARKVTPQTVTLTAHDWLIIMGALGLRGDIDPRTLPIRDAIYRQTQDMNGLIERSSFGDAEATAARESVTDEKARDLVERSKRKGQDHTNGSTK